jgi:glycosyltransferase involved in cell wall biosynthesis
MNVCPMKISVITVLHNARNTISDTIASVRSQDYPDFEHILIDGASTDGSIAQIYRSRHDKLVLVSEPDAGIYDAMNKGASIATGDLIGFLNADDYFCRTDSLSIIGRTAAQNPRSAAVSAAVTIVDAVRPNRHLRAYSATSFRRWMLRFGHMPPHPGFYVRRSMFQAVGPFSTEYKIASDFEWMVRFYLTEKLAAVSIPETLVAMRTGGTSTRGLQSMRIINAEAFRALSSHRIRTSAPLIWSKYLAKVGQMAFISANFKSPLDVRWEPARSSRQSTPKC